MAQIQITNQVVGATTIAADQRSETKVVSKVVSATIEEVETVRATVIVSHHVATMATLHVIGIDPPTGHHLWKGMPNVRQIEFFNFSTPKLYRVL